MGRMEKGKGAGGGGGGLGEWAGKVGKVGR